MKYIFSIGFLFLLLPAKLMGQYIHKMDQHKELYLIDNQIYTFQQLDFLTNNNQELKNLHQDPLNYIKKRKTNFLISGIAAGATTILHLTNRPNGDYSEISDYAAQYILGITSITFLIRGMLSNRKVIKGKKRFINYYNDNLNLSSRVLEEENPINIEIGNNGLGFVVSF